MDKLKLAGAAAIDDTDLCRVHTQRYIEEFRQVSKAGGGDIGDFAPFSAGGFDIACISAGLAKAAMSDVMAGRVNRAYALCRPAGHHCLSDRSMGFCVLANIPIAVEAARAEHGLGKVAILDWDVHHGNGTQSIYYDRGDTLTISIHQENCFPPGYSGVDDRGSGEGAGANINISLPPVREMPRIARRSTRLSCQRLIASSLISSWSRAGWMQGPQTPWLACSRRAKPSAP